MRKRIVAGFGMVTLVLLSTACGQSAFDKCVEETKSSDMGIIENYDYCKVNEDQYG